MALLTKLGLHQHEDAPVVIHDHYPGHVSINPKID